MQVLVDFKCPAPYLKGFLSRKPYGSCQDFLIPGANLGVAAIKSAKPNLNISRNFAMREHGNFLIQYHAVLEHLRLVLVLEYANPLVILAYGGTAPEFCMFHRG